MLHEPEPIDSRLLHTFDVVARTGSVTAAARELGRTQPAISHRLRALEDDFGVRLFERHGQRLQLTEYGLRLQAACVDLVAQSRHLREHVCITTEYEGTATIGTLPALGSHLLAVPITEILTRHPAIQLHFDFDFVEPLTRRLRKGTLDLAVVIGEVDFDGLATELLGATRPVLAFPPQLSLEAGCEVTVDEIASTGLRYIAYGGRSDPTFDAVERFARRNGLMDDRTPRIPHIESLRSIVAGGGGCAILPEYAITTDRAEGRLRTTAVQGLALVAPVYLVSRETAVVTPVLEIVRRTLRAVEVT